MSENNYNGSFPPVLPSDEEQIYIKQAEEGSKTARNILIERNLRLVAHIVKKYTNYQKDFEDLVSIGTIGLIKAINTYKSGKQTRLATYAARCIENEILMYIRQNRKRKSDYYLQDAVGCDKDGNEVTLQDKIADNDRAIDETVETKLAVKLLEKKLKSELTKREREILTLRYGLHGSKELTQREIAKLLGISRSYVSRIEKKALKKLKALPELQ